MHYQKLIDLKVEQDKEKQYIVHLESIIQRLKHNRGVNGSILKSEIQGGEPTDEINKARRLKVKNVILKLIILFIVLRKM